MQLVQPSQHGYKPTRCCLGNLDSILSPDKDFLLCSALRDILWPQTNQPYVQGVPRVFSPKLKRPKCETYHSPSCKEIQKQIMKNILLQVRHSDLDVSMTHGWQISIHKTPTLSPWAFRPTHLFPLGAKSYNLAWKTSESSVSRQEVTACFTLASGTNRFSANFFLRGQKRWKLLVPIIPTGLTAPYSAVRESFRDTVYSPDLVHCDIHILGRD
jgi:hypothetical protein